MNNDVYTFTSSQWETFFNEKNLFSCLVISDNPSDQWSINHSYSLPMSPEISFNFQIPNETADIYMHSTKSETINSYYTSGYTITDSNIGIPGIFKTNISTKSQHSNTSTDKEYSFFVTALRHVPKVRIVLKEDNIKLSDNFVNAVKQAVSNNSNSDNYNALSTVLNEYGQYIITDVILGGALYTTASKEISEKSQEEEFENSVKVGFEANLEAFDIPIGGGSSVDSGSTSKKSSSSTQEKSSFSLNAIGGDPSKIFNYSDWSASLEPWSNWRIIQTNVLVPIINFLPKDLGIKCANIILNQTPDTDYIKDLTQRANSGLFNS